MFSTPRFSFKLVTMEVRITWISKFKFRKNPIGPTKQCKRAMLLQSKIVKKNHWDINLSRNIFYFHSFDFEKWIWLSYFPLLTTMGLRYLWSSNHLGTFTYYVRQKGGGVPKSLCSQGGRGGGQGLLYNRGNVRGGAGRLMDPPKFGKLMNALFKS